MTRAAESPDRDRNSRGPETLRDLASEVGATAVTALEASRSGEVVVITIPERAVPDLSRDLFAGVPADVVLIDTGNYHPTRDGRVPAMSRDNRRARGSPSRSAARSSRHSTTSTSRDSLKMATRKTRRPHCASGRWRSVRSARKGAAPRRRTRLRSGRCRRDRRIVAPAAGHAVLHPCQQCVAVEGRARRNRPQPCARIR